MDASLADRDLFDRAVALPPDERVALLDAAGLDPGVRARIEAWLAAHDAAGEAFLERSASEIAAQAVGRAGRRLGAYRIVRELGRGGMGAVYLASRADAEFEKEVAIKIVAAPLGDEELVRRFRRERQILAELQHPLIAQLLDGGTTEDGLPYLVMELVDGQRIDRYCEARQLGPRERIRLFLDVCEAVQYAHAHLVVHRDLKPQNILVTPDGRAKLLDFGVASLATTEQRDTRITQTGLQAMTPEYASPEQLRGERIGTASDLYSLGVILYELLTGTRPYDLAGRRPDEAYRAVTELEPPRPSAAADSAGEAGLARRLRGDLDAIVMTALRKEPQRRYASVALFADDLRRHLDGRQVAARGEALSYRVSSFVQRHRLPLGAAAGVVLILLSGIAATVQQARIAEGQRHEAERQRARAEQRFAEVRQLASALLFELHDAIAHLPGATQARRLVVGKALQYLDGLAAESAGDVSLQRELAAAYDKVGDVQGNPSTANLGDASGALESYRKAEAIRRRIVADNPQNLDARLELSTSVLKIADALVGRGAVKDAVGLYREAVGAREAALLENRPSSGAAHRAVVEATGRLCTTLLAIGDPQGALENCRRNRAVAEAQLQADPGDAVMRGHRATNAVAMGNALRLTRQLPEAEGAFVDAISRHLELLAPNPENAEVRRRLAIAYGYLANVHLDLGRPEEAARAFGQAIDELTRLYASDPSNARTPPELAYMLNQRARVLVKLNRRAEARTEAHRAIQLARVSADRAGAGGDALNEYAWALVSAEPAELRNPARAAAYARLAIDRAGAPNPVYLHTLGSAQYQLGRRIEAIRTLEQALTLIPAGAAGPATGIRRQIEADLARYKAAQPAR